MDCAQYVVQVQVILPNEILKMKVTVPYALANLPARHACWNVLPQGRWCAHFDIHACLTCFPCSMGMGTVGFGYWLWYIQQSKVAVVWTHHCGLLTPYHVGKKEISDTETQIALYSSLVWESKLCHVFPKMHEKGEMLWMAFKAWTWNS